MPFTDEQKRRNAEEFAAIKVMLACYELDRQAEARIGRILELLEARFNDAEIIASVVVGQQRLVDMVFSRYLQERDKEAGDIRPWLDQCVTEYANLDQEASSQNNARHDRAAQGIARRLANADMHAAYEWGTDHDLRLVLKGEITSPDDVSTAGTYILPPVSIASGKSDDHKELQTALQTVANSANGKTDLLVPVNSGQSHWMLVKATVENEKVTDAELVDSSSNPSLGTSRACENVKRAIASMSAPNVTVHATATGQQHDGHSCMDHTVQAALKAKYKNQPAPAILQPICDASDGVALRVAVTGAIRTNVKIQATVSAISAVSTTVAPITQGMDEKSLYVELTKEQTKEARSRQELFDGIMAQNLHRLFDQHPDGNDKELVDQARAEACKLFSNFR